MRQILGHCAAVLGRVILMGFGIQIILGLIWMCNAFVRMGSPGEGFICVFQAAVFGGSVCFVLRIMRKSNVPVMQDVFGVLSVLTFPMIMQCVVTPDIRCITTSLLLFETGCIMRALEDMEDRLCFRLSLCAWLAAGLIRREYLYFGAIPMVWYMLSVYAGSRKGADGTLTGMGSGRRTGYRLLLILAVGGLTAGTGSLYQEKTDFYVQLANRTAWTSLYKTYVEMDKADRKLIDYQTMVESTYEAIGLETVLWPSLEEEHGTKEAQRIMARLSKVAWKNGKKQILKEIIWDMAGYVMPPLVLPMQLEGRAYDSYSGVNYLQILRTNPGLGSLYMRCGCSWFNAAALATFMTGMSCVAAGRDKRYKRLIRNYVIMSVTALGMCAGYTLSESGRMDYKNVLFVLCLWLLAMITTGEHGVALTGGSDGKEG